MPDVAPYRWNIRRSPSRDALQRLGAPEAVPIVGAVYDVIHERKGTFRVRVTEAHHDWLDGIIVSGRAMNIAIAENPDDWIRKRGDVVTIMGQYCELIQVEEDHGESDSASER